MRAGEFDKLKPFSVGSLQEASALMHDPRWEDDPGVTEELENENGCQ